jgi:phospholipid-binding lipoprotein MlaA
MKTKELKKILRGLSGLFAVALIVGCSTNPSKKDDVVEAKHSVGEVVKSDVTYAIDIYDPWEGFNRSIYKFNAKFDEAIFLPVVHGYQYIAPEIVQMGVSNFFNNIEDLKTLVNTILQLKPQASVETASRIVLNTTVGILGLIDMTDMPRHDEDFGQTLGWYGIGNGPYLVLPILGPSNLRDTGGLVVDSAVFNAIDPWDFDDHSDRQVPYYLLNAIDTRANIGFRYFGTGSPFEYDMVRMLYTKKRQIEIAK